MTQREVRDAALALQEPEQASHSRLPRRLFRTAVHAISYRLILNRTWTATTRAAGFRLTVPPTVFHPQFFITSKYFAGFVDNLDLKGLRVADLGTGSGIIALAAARAGARHVVAIDINPNAAVAARRNAEANGLGDRVTGLCSNLLAAVAPGRTFDVILSNPPFIPGEPRDLADRAWHAGPGYRDILQMFDEVRERLAPGGIFYLLISSDTDTDLMQKLMIAAGLRPEPVSRRRIVVESFVIYQATLV
jgi:release factor glutamine methyltransferase